MTYGSLRVVDCDSPYAHDRAQMYMLNGFNDIASMYKLSGLNVCVYC